jgi:class 3 adenylate cyclase
VSRSILVVLLVDTVKSTALLSRIGQDRMDALTSLEMAELRGAIVEGGGTILRSTGDGLLATFPTASGALDASSAVHRRVARLNEGDRLDVDLRVRVTLAASDITVHDDGISGIAPVLTARLEAHAGAGETVCTEVVRLLAQGRGDHEFERMEPLQLEGLPEPVVAYRVRASMADRLGMPETLDATRRFDFVGRAPERERLDATWEAARHGQGSMVVLSGEPGIGKTRLCRELASAVLDEGAIVLHGSCAELTGWSFEPFVQSLRHCLARIADAGEVMGTDPGPLARVVPELRDRLPTMEVPDATDAETDRHRLFEAVTTWLVGLSRRAPLLYVLDDLSWADEASVSLLRHLVAQIADERILIVASYRPADAVAHARSFVQEAGRAVQRIELSGLDGSHALAFAERLLDGRLDHAARDVVVTASRRVGGNPLYLGEIVSHLVETGELAAASGEAWTAVSHDGATVVPPSVEDIIVRRIDRLAVTSERLLQVAAVVGATFPPALLVDLLDSPPAECAAALEEAVSAGFLQQVVAADGEQRVDFTHAVFRDVVYHRLSPLRRMAEHRRVGAAIERVYAADLSPWLEVLALQYEQAVALVGRDRAIDALREAGRQAEVQLGHDHAAGFYRRALQLAAGGSVAERAQRCALLIDVGTAERRSGRQVARRTLLDATALALELGDRELATRAVLGSGRGIFSQAGSIDDERVGALREVLALVGTERTDLRARLLAALGAELIFDDEPGVAEAASDEALSIARELGDPATLVSALAFRMVAIWRVDRVRERLALGAELDAMRRMAGRRSGQFLIAVTFYCQAAMEHGDIELADELLEWIEATAHELRQPTSVAYAKLRLASRASVAGRLTEAERLATDAYRACVDAGQVDAEAFYAGQLFTIRLHQGRLDEVVDLIERSAASFPGVRAFAAAAATCGAELDDLTMCRRWLDDVAGEIERVRFDLNWLPTMTLTALAASRLGDRTIAARLRPMLAPYRALFVDNASTYFGSVHLYDALCASTVGDGGSADDEFAAALAAHQRIDSPPLLARTRLEWAAALAGRGDGRAAELARAALADADRLGYRTVATRSAALLTAAADAVG